YQLRLGYLAGQVFIRKTGYVDQSRFAAVAQAAAEAVEIPSSSDKSGTGISAASSRSAAVRERFTGMPKRPNRLPKAPAVRCLPGHRPGNNHVSFTSRWVLDGFRCNNMTACPSCSGSSIGSSARAMDTPFLLYRTPDWGLATMRDTGCPYSKTISPATRSCAFMVSSRSSQRARRHRSSGAIALMNVFLCRYDETAVASPLSFSHRVK